MTAIVFLLVALAGGLGAAARFALDYIVTGATTRRAPIGTIVINVSGSLLLGFVIGLGSDAMLNEAWLAVLGSGFLGGYTTFSTASYETVRLVQQRRLAVAGINAFGTLILATFAAAAGLAFASLV